VSWWRPGFCAIEGALCTAEDGRRARRGHPRRPLVSYAPFLALYGVINNAGVHNPELTAEAKELVDFMKVGKRKRPAEAKGGPAAPTPEKPS
jgi:hypothetical protein